VLFQALRASLVARDSLVHLDRTDFRVQLAPPAVLDLPVNLEMPVIRAVRDSRVLRVLSAPLEQQVSLLTLLMSLLLLSSQSLVE